MPDKIKYLKEIYAKKRISFWYSFLVVGNLRKNTFEMLICAKHNRIIVENDELNKILRKIIDK